MELIRIYIYGCCMRKFLMGILFWAALTSPSVAEYDVGLMAFTNKNYLLSLEEFRKSAREGHAGAEFMLGVHYFNGFGVERDSSIAAIYFHLAAEKGNPEAQLAFGSIFIRGVGVWQNLVRAHYWLSLAVSTNNESTGLYARVLRDATEKLMTDKEVREAKQLAASWQYTRAGIISNN